MKEKLIQFQEEIDKFDKLREEWEEKKKVLEKENSTLLADITASSVDIDVARAAIKALAEDEYNLTKNKQLIGGLGIRIMTALKYDPEKALVWAKNHDMCLTLNKRDFDKIAKIQEIDFVSKIENVVVTFPPKIEFGDGE